MIPAYDLHVDVLLCFCINVNPKQKLNIRNFYAIFNYPGNRENIFPFKGSREFPRK